jgi:hypothetical protein
MKKKNGFIATSLMYSFFAVFSMVALIIIATYTHYRVLINNINNNVLNELNTQIASKYTTLYNLVNNGDFEENSDWNYTNTTRIEKNVPYGSSYSGTYSARMPKTDSSFNQTFSIKDKVNVDNKYHKVYVAFRVFRNGPVNGTGTINLNASGTDNAVNGSSLIGGFSNWILYSQILKVGVTDETDWTLSFNITGNTTNNYTYIDNVMVIDITSEYNGNTTPDTDMKNYLDTYLNYFNDSYTMTKYGNGSSIAEEEVPKPVCTYTKNQEFNFSYTGGEQTFTPECSGYYKLETWGAQGGTANTSYPSTGGYGGYAIGIVSLTSSDTLYINVGGAGSPNNNSNTSGATGGYNGGGNSGYVNTSIYGEIWSASGGGATHIAKASGLLKNLSSNKASILIASGGGAGGFCHNNLSVHSWGEGGSGGGYIGGTGTTYGSGYTVGQGGTQSAAGYTSASASYPGGFGFGGYGVGGNSASYYFSGGGSGYYGGSGAVFAGAGGGSGYIGNTLLVSLTSLTKHMTCCNCSASTDASTKTTTTTNTSSTATSDYAKQGNGYAKITYIGDTLN